jgi:hypothetical protein
MRKNFVSISLFRVNIASGLWFVDCISLGKKENTVDSKMLNVINLNLIRYAL